ncbi:MAG: response regulator [Candidatus Latescibacterota bacterium]|nr:MAG: response regulator [Candidatus Latescibacterota bacterium]
MERGWRRLGGVRPRASEPGERARDRRSRRGPAFVRFRVPRRPDPLALGRGAEPRRAGGASPRARKRAIRSLPGSIRKPRRLDAGRFARCARGSAAFGLVVPDPEGDRGVRGRPRGPRGLRALFPIALSPAQHPPRSRRIRSRAGRRRPRGRKEAEAMSDKKRSDPKSPSEALSAPGHPHELLKGIRILVVDDDPVVRIMVRRTVARFGGEAETTPSGEEALEALTSSLFGIVLMDTDLPGIDGFEVARRIRNRGSSVLHHEVAIVALASRDSDEDRQRSLEAGFDAFLPKPVAVRELLKTIRKLTRPGGKPL